METLQFHPARMREEAQRLSSMAAGVGATLEELEPVPGLLQGQLGDSTLSQALAGLIRQGEDQAGALRELAGVLECVAAIYEGAERTLVTQAGQLPGSPGWRASGTGGGSIPTPIPTGPAQFGPFLVDDWLARLVLEEEQQAGQAEGSQGGEDTPYGGVTGPLDEAWDWVKEDHSWWQAGVNGDALGGVAVGSAGISVLHYASEFQLGDDYSKETNRSFDGTPGETEEGVSMGIGAGGSGSVLHAEAEGRIGGDYLGLYGEASGGAGVITAGGTVGVFADEEGFFAGAQGEAGVYAAQGEVTGGLDLGFMKIGGSLEGSVGLGVSGEIGFDNGEFTIGASATPGLGGGFSLSVDFSPVIDWFEDFF